MEKAPCSNRPDANVERPDEEKKREKREHGQQVDRGRAGESPGQGQGEQHTAQCGAGDVGGLENVRAPGHGVDEVLPGYEVRQQRARRRPAEGAARADEKQHRVDVPDVGGVMIAEPEEPPAGEGLQYVTEKDHIAAVEAIGRVACGQLNEGSAGRGRNRARPV